MYTYGLQQFITYIVYFAGEVCTITILVPYQITIHTHVEHSNHITRMSLTNANQISAKQQASVAHNTSHILLQVRKLSRYYRCISGRLQSLDIVPLFGISPFAFWGFGFLFLNYMLNYKYS